MSENPQSAPAQRYTAELAGQIENYPRENLYAMMNLISSHDVQRAITVLAGVPYYEGMPAIEQSRVRMTQEQFDLGSRRLLMATLWQMTYPGVPSVYYGDEIGMEDVDLTQHDAQDGFHCSLQDDRNRARTPMQWNSSRYAGFANVLPWLPVVQLLLPK